MTLSAVDTIHRGLVNLRANWELIPVQFLQILIGTLLFLVGFLLWRFWDLPISSYSIRPGRIGRR